MQKKSRFHNSKKHSKTKKEAEKKHEALSSLESLWGKIISHKKVKKHEIQKHAEKVKPKHVIGKAQKFASLKELKKQAQEIHKTIKEQPAEPLAKEHVEKIKEVAKEIIMHRITTDFDRVMFYVQEHGHAKIGTIAKDLSIDSKRIEECAKILEENKLLEIEYPLVGEIGLQEIDYRQKMKKRHAKKPKQKIEQKKK